MSIKNWIKIASATVFSLMLLCSFLYKSETAFIQKEIQETLIQSSNCSELNGINNLTIEITNINPSERTITTLKKDLLQSSNSLILKDIENQPIFSSYRYKQYSQLTPLYIVNRSLLI